MSTSSIAAYSTVLNPKYPDLRIVNLIREPTLVHLKRLNDITAFGNEMDPACEGRDLTPQNRYAPRIP